MEAGILALLVAIIVGNAATAPRMVLPDQLAGKAEVLTADDPAYGRAAVANAVKPGGQGGVSNALVVRLTRDVPVYRVWNGPGKKDTRGNTNRMGSWWSYDAPAGSMAKYRFDYEICRDWNDLVWVATCTLKKGAVVAIGPGQSVSSATCGNAAGFEDYPNNRKGWQTYVDKPWARGEELVCPPDTADYPANPLDISRPQ